MKLINKMIDMIKRKIINVLAIIPNELCVIHKDNMYHVAYLTADSDDYLISVNDNTIIFRKDKVSFRAVIVAKYIIENLNKRFVFTRSDNKWRRIIEDCIRS